MKKDQRNSFMIRRKKGTPIKSLKKSSSVKDKLDNQILVSQLLRLQDLSDRVYENIPISKSLSPAASDSNIANIDKFFPEESDNFVPGATDLITRRKWYEELRFLRKGPNLAQLGSKQISGFAATPLDITCSPNASILSDREFELCSFLRLQPLQYFECRRVLLNNYAEMGFYKKSAAQKMLRIDVNKTGRLYDFFVAMNWLPSEPSKVPFTTSPLFM